MYADTGITGRWVFFWRVAILVTFLVAWQFLPEWSWAQSQVRWLDPFFISSPTRVYERLKDLFGGSGDLSIWPFLWTTLKATFIGTASGIAIGASLGAILSNNESLARVFQIYITMLNAVPRIAMIPIVVLIVGPTLTASVFAAILVVTFLTFFNAVEGGRSVPSHVLQNAALLGASRRQMMLRVRLPYVMMWTFAAVPNAIAFGLLMVVTAEVLTGSPGMGQLILASTTNVDATLAFSVAVVLSVVGGTLVALADRLKRRLLHWTY